MPRFTPRRSIVLLSVLALLTGLIVAPVSAAPPAGKGPKAKPAPSTDKMILYASDGMRPDLVDKYVAEGAMPTYADLIRKGVKGDNGLVQAFPPNTGVGWHTLATGAWPGEHGSMNNTYFRVGEGNFNNRTSFATTGALQADHIAQAAERAGKKVVSVEWVGARNLVPALQGPVVDFRNFLSNRGILLNYDLAGQPAGAAAFGVSYQRVDLDAAAGWTNVPASFSPARQEQLRLTNTAFPAADNVDRLYDLYIYDPTNDGVTNYAASSSSRRPTARTGARRTRTSVPASGPRSRYAHRRPRRPDRGLLHEGDRDRAGPVEVPGLLRVDRRANATYNALGAAGSAHSRRP